MRVSREVYNLLQSQQSVVVVVVLLLVFGMNQEVVRLQYELGVVPDGRVVLASTHSNYSGPIVVSLTQNCPDLPRLDTVRGGKDVSVTDESPTTSDEVTAGDVPHEDEDDPGKLVGDCLLPSVHSHVQRLLRPHPALASEVGSPGGDGGEEETEQGEEHSWWITTKAVTRRSQRNLFDQLVMAWLVNNEMNHGPTFSGHIFVIQCYTLQCDG